MMDKQSSSPIYFSIPPGRLAFFSIITIGFYQFYWHYKNWKAIKEAEQEKIMPFWRSFFSIFFAYSLFKKIAASAKEHKYSLKESYSPGWVATAYILLLLMGNGFGKNDDIATNIVFLIIVSFTVVPLLTVQRAINFINSKSMEDYIEERKFTSGEIVLTVVGVLIFALVLIGTFFLE